jgi:phospholipase D1/2
MPEKIAEERLLRPGDTCWRIERANRMAVIVDAADYFATVRAAVQRARHSVLLIGWDFDTRIRLDRADDGSGVPNTLGKFLKWIVRKRPELRVYVLRWDLGVLHSLGRGTTPLVILDWMTSKRVRFKLDGAHPAGSAHHQKIVVIDDALAFCGGIDMTADRWDTREHLDDDPQRVRPTTTLWLSTSGGHCGAQDRNRGCGWLPDPRHRGAAVRRKIAGAIRAARTPLGGGRGAGREPAS